jgi:general secretion pathway protein G
MAKRGFTIMELLIVISVVAILIAMAVPRFKGIQEEGNVARAKGDVRTLLIAVESYRMHGNGLPGSLSALIASTTKPNMVGSSLPKDPFKSGSDYGYGMSPDKSYYVIWSAGPSGSDTASVADSGDVTLSSADTIYASDGKI